jgi:hypothetical protein
LHRVALHAQHRLSAERGSANDLRLERKLVAVPARDVDDRPDSLLTRESHGGKRRHPWLTGVIIGQPDDIYRVGQHGDAVADTRAIRLGRQ